MVSVGTAYKCDTCQTEVEVVRTNGMSAGPLVCCEATMQPVADEFDKLYQAEAYDAMDFDWN
jgi:hypothetical protein